MDRASKSDWEIAEKGGYTQIKSVFFHPYRLITYCLFLLLLFSGIIHFWIYEEFTSFSFILIFSSSIPGYICYRSDINYRLECYKKGLEIKAQEDARVDEELNEEKEKTIKLIEENLSKGELENYQQALNIYRLTPEDLGFFKDRSKDILEIKTKIAKEYEKLKDYDKAIETYEELELPDDIIRVKKLLGDDKVKHLDYNKAIEIYDSIGDKESAKKARKLKAEQGAVKVSQKVVHGDEVTNTEIKDSVLNRSNVGGNSSKMQELEKLAEMKKEGLIDEDEFKQMKKEILGK